MCFYTPEFVGFGVGVAEGLLHGVTPWVVAFSGCLFGNAIFHFVRFVVAGDFQFAEQAADNGFGNAVFALFVLAQQLRPGHF